MTHHYRSHHFACYYVRVSSPHASSLFIPRTYRGSLPWLRTCSTKCLLNYQYMHKKDYHNKLPCFNMFHSSPASPPITSFTTPHLPHHSSPASPPITCLTTPHLPHHPSPASPPITCLTTNHLPQHSSPASLLLTCLTTPHLPHHQSPASSPITCLTTPHLPHHPSPASPPITTYLSRDTCPHYPEC